MPFTSGGLPSEHLSHFALVLLDGGCALDPTLEDSGNMKGLLILTSVAAVVAMAPPAYADDPPSGVDAEFVSQLKDAGLTHQDPTKAIAAAKDLCSLADNGTADTEIESNLMSLNPGLTAHGADEFMALSAAAYCPKYLSKYMTGKGWTTKPSGDTKPPGDEGKPPSDAAKPPGS
jgi:Protein of unknown function (DUF732)